MESDRTLPWGSIKVTRMEALELISLISGSTSRENGGWPWLEKSPASHSALS